MLILAQQYYLTGGYIAEVTAADKTALSISQKAIHMSGDLCQVAGPSEIEQEDLHSYVVVERQDVLEAIGTFVAAYLATIPQAQDLPPKELQAAVARAFQVGSTTPWSSSTAAALTQTCCVMHSYCILSFLGKSPFQGSSVV